MIKRFARVAAAAAALSLLVAACGDDDDVAGGDDDASVSFAAPRDGDEVTSPVGIEMVADGVEIEPAGEVNEGAGHFHVMVDVGCVDEGETIPGDTEGYNHYGKAQTAAELELEPGEHTLCLQVGDGEHTATGLTEEITITVTE